MNVQNKVNGVLLIYMGGTIGSIAKNKQDPNSPLVPLQKEDVLKIENPIFDLIKSYDTHSGCVVLAKQSVRLEMKSLEKPIDSSNITPEIWTEITKIIKETYNHYEGFVILSGTDTMAYTASVLSFMIDNLNKPIIITGSQRPIDETRSDAVQNIVSAIEIAAAGILNKPIVPEVCVFFRNKLFRGCRTVKLSASNYEAFQSPNFPELGTADEHIVINERFVRKGSSQALHITNAYSPKVMFLKIAPGMDFELLESIVTSDKLEGIILLTYGTGNAPTSVGFLNAIDKAIKKGKIVVNVTQCISGEVELGLYDVSATLLSLGVISGVDMTAEAAYTKLCYLLGLYKTHSYKIALVSDLMQINLKGEQRQSIFNLHFGSGEMVENNEKLVLYPLNEMTDVKPGKYNPQTIETAYLRIIDVTESGKNKIQKVKGKIFIDIEDANSQFSEQTENYLGSFDKAWNNEDGIENIVIDITHQAKKFIDNRHPVGITIINENGSMLKWEKMQIGIFINE